jgi:hypothetical protein
MVESNCHDLHMESCRQVVRMLEEKFNGFELHYVLRCDNEAADTLARLKSSHIQPPPGVFVQDLVKPSIRLNEDDLVPALGTQQEGGSPAPTQLARPRTWIGGSGCHQTIQLQPRPVKISF